MSSPHGSRVGVASHRRPLLVLGRLGAVAASVFGVAAMVSCSRQAPPPIARTAVAQADPPPVSRPPAAEREPASLVRISDSARKLFDTSRASKWEDVAAPVADSHDAVASLNINGLNPDLAAQLRSRIAARRFTDIVVQLEGAKRPADFVAPVRAELAAVDRLETIFKQ